MNEKRETITFHYDVPSGESRSYSKEIGHNARIKEIRAQFIDGEDGDKRVDIYSLTADKTRVEVLNIVGDRKYLNGNDSIFVQKLDVPIRCHTSIFVDAVNVDTHVGDDLYTYPVIVEVYIEYEGKV